MTALEKAAMKWWKLKRPLAYTESQHIKNPTINCRNWPESNLAAEVSRMLEKKK